jgi:hypothetical protein
MEAIILSGGIWLITLLITYFDKREETQWRNGFTVGIFQGFFMMMVFIYLLK